MINAPENGPWDELVYTDEYAPAPGVPISAAIARLAAWEGLDRAQVAAVNYLQTGIWTATCQRAFQRQGVLKISPKGGYQSFLTSLERRWTSGSRCYAHGRGYLSQRFWNEAHLSAGTEWHFDIGFLWPDGARAHFERGLIETFTGFPFDDSDAAEFMGIYITAFGVEISEFDVEATAPPVTKSEQSATRSTVFDWEAAFADVAARFYHDVEFADLNARGVQAEVIGFLRSSFEERRLPVPTDDTLKPKARKLLGALRGKKPE